MPSESLQPNFPKSLESLKKSFKERLDKILHKQLTIENIEVFADEALNETIKLTDDVLAEYKRNPNFNPGPLPENTKAQENDAFEILGLPNIQEVLESIIEVKDKIDSLKTYLNTNVENVDVVITPPQENQAPHIEKSDGSFKKKEIFPRLLTLLYILQHDFDITPTPETVTIKEGVVTKDMMRKTPYVRIEIPELNRVVYICEEEGNVSYVFDTAKLKEKNLTLDEIDVDDKRDKNSLIAYHPGIGIAIRQSQNWRSIVATILREPIPEKQTEIPEEHEKQERSRISEFEKKVWLPFDEFQEEVRNLHQGKENVFKWYQKELKKVDENGKKIHLNWPSRPEKIYKGKGWVDWRELVEKIWLPFKYFKGEVMDLYPRKESVLKWYQKELKKVDENGKKIHLNWPSHPDKTYKGKGWVDWRELVEKIWLPFKYFKGEVMDLYPRKENVFKWYQKELKKVDENGKKIHLNWPSHPDKTYKGKGWVDWRELVEKIWLPFDKFQKEVKFLDQGERNVTKWYKKERKEHKNWPSRPEKIYKGKGWVDWRELVEKIWLPFDKFQEEVKFLYQGEGDLLRWYEKERKEHKNWPSRPDNTYKGKGWIGFNELLGKENRLKKKT